ncbi:MAG TPA: hypothetical protein ENJ38_07260 [Rhodospirillales bacterium]|nr:hypothetical protein [Rhodospirillales bacterium]
MYRTNPDRKALWRPLLISLALLLGTVPVMGAFAARDDAGTERARVVREAKARTGGGRVLSVQPLRREGRKVYRVKVLTPEGRVLVLWIEP